MESIGKTVYPIYAHFLSLTLRKTQKPFGVMPYICDHDSNYLHLLSIVIEIDNQNARLIMDNVGGVTGTKAYGKTPEKMVKTRYMGNACESGSNTKE